MADSKAWAMVKKLREWHIEGKKTFVDHRGYTPHLEDLLNIKYLASISEAAFVTPEVYKKLDAMLGPNGYAMYRLLIEQRWGSAPPTTEETPNGKAKNT